MNYAYLFVDNLNGHSYENGLNELRTSIATLKRFQQHDSIQVFNNETFGKNIDYFRKENVIHNHINLSRSYGKSDDKNPINILVEKIISLKNYNEDEDIVLLDIDTSFNTSIPEDFWDHNHIVLDNAEYYIMQWRNLDKVLPQIPWKQFDINFDSSFIMYNTGVIHIPKRFRKELCEKALSIVDYLNENFDPEERCGNKLDEQIALSIVCHDTFGKYGHIKLSNNYIHHHWEEKQNNIKWWESEEFKQFKQQNYFYEFSEIRDKKIKIESSLHLLEEYFYSLQEIINPECTIEIGAFEANFSKQMKKKFTCNVECWAFEANPYNFDYFRNLEDFHSLGINYVNLAISDKTDEINFYLQDKDKSTGVEINKIVGNNSILNRNDENISYDSVAVKSMSLDDFLYKFNLEKSNKSIWVDVEGANKNVLMGAFNSLDNIVSIMIEVEDKEYWKDQWLSHDVINFLYMKGFVPILKDFYCLTQYNVIFVKQEYYNDPTNKQKINNLIENYYRDIEFSSENIKTQSIPNKKSVLVTGLWDINRENLNGIWNRSYDEYLENFSHLLDTDNDLIIFGDEKLKEIVFSKRSSENTKFIIKTSDWFRNREYFNLIQKNRLNPNWINQNEWIKDSPQGSLEYYNPIIMSKMILLNEAITKDDFGYENYYWIDGGIRIKNHNYNKSLIDDISNYTNFLFITFPYEGKEVHGFDFGKMKSLTLESPNMVSRGGFFGGHKNNIVNISQLYYKLLIKTLSEGFMGTEESIFTILLYKYPKLIDYYRLDENANGDPELFFKKFKESNDRKKLFNKINKKNLTTNQYKLPLSVGILSWNSNYTLKNTLEAYKSNGLFEIANDITLFFQECCEEDISIANEYKIPFIAYKENIGIGEAFIKLCQTAKTDNILLLENDWELIEDKTISFNRLKSGIDMLNDGYDCIRYRHRKTPGYPLYSKEPYCGSELNHYDNITDSVSPHLIECCHWIDDVDLHFPDKIQKVNDHYVTSSRWSCFTNNPCMYKKDFYLSKVKQFVSKSKLLENDISYWWVRQDFKVAWGEGLFKHNDIEKYGNMF